MKKEVIKVVVLAIVVLLGTIGYFKYQTPAVIEVVTCSQSEYPTMIENLPTQDCSTQWVVICGENATWKYQCFQGEILSDEDTLRAELEAAQQKFYELCEQNPDLVCG